MSNELSDKEAQELFAQVSTAIQDADKLNELMSAEPTEEEEFTGTPTSEETTTEEENTSVEMTE